MRYIKAPTTVSFQGGNSLDTVTLMQYLLRELEQIERAFTEFDTLQLKQLNAAPDRIRDGMIVYADGTNWNPGSGEGYYGYYASAWHKLG